MTPSIRRLIKPRLRKVAGMWECRVVLNPFSAQVRVAYGLTPISAYRSAKGMPPDLANYMPKP